LKKCIITCNSISTKIDLYDLSRILKKKEMNLIKIGGYGDTLQKVPGVFKEKNPQRIHIINIFMKQDTPVLAFG
jgi:hypothetical protein